MKTKILRLVCAVLVPLMSIPLAADLYCAVQPHLFPQQTPAPPAALELHAGPAVPRDGGTV